MSALHNDLSMVGPASKNNHAFHAEANVLYANLKQPLEEEIRPQAFVKLPRGGQYQFRQADPFHFEGILSYKSGYTQVAGHPSLKKAGFETLATSVVEGLNVLDVVTADRVVGQISTWHPVYGEGQVPSVTFLGTRFENLRIDGHQVEVERDLEILGPRHDDDRSYFDDRDVRNRIGEQYDTIATTKNLPKWASEEYPKNRPAQKGQNELKCSVINGVKGSPGFPFGHVIDLPHFGRIYLGELKVVRTPGDRDKKINDTYRFHLTMIRLHMGCLATGGVGVGTLDANGTGSGGGTKGGGGN
jgi:hypothetical protein